MLEKVKTPLFDRRKALCRKTLQFANFPLVRTEVVAYRLVCNRHNLARKERHVSFFDYLWIVRLVIEILKIIANLSESERLEIANLRTILPDFGVPDQKPTKPKKA